MKTFLFFIALGFSLSGLAQQNLEEVLAEYNQETVPYISVKELSAIKQNGGRIILLDARESAEYKTSHLAGALHVGYDDFDKSKIARLNLNPKDTVVVYCTVGVRSEDIGEQLQQLGFKDVRNLKGGIVYWKNQGQPVYNMRNQITDKVHVYGPGWGKWLTNGIPTYE